MTFEEWYGTEDFEYDSELASAAWTKGAASRDTEVAELANGLDKALKCIRYMQGIAERGLGRKMLDEEAPDLFVLSYVKSIEQERDQLRKDVEMLRELLKKWAFTHSPNEEAHIEVQEALAATEPKE